MSEQGQPTPVRAWAEYDEWSMFWRGPAEWWSGVMAPKGATGYEDEVTCHSDYPPVAVAWELEPPLGPLRSMRVLFSTGHEIAVRPLPAEAFGPNAYSWRIKGPGYVVHADTDAEAVERAIRAAVEWIEQQGGGEG